MFKLKTKGIPQNTIRRNLTQKREYVYNGELSSLAFTLSIDNKKQLTEFLKLLEMGISDVREDLERIK